MTGMGKLRTGKGRQIREVGRTKISAKVACELHGRAGGHCEFDGCVKPLYNSAVTQQRVHQAEMGHIWSYSPGGARGQGPYTDDQNCINEIDNLILVCRGCHKLIDDDKEGRIWSAERLKEFKERHERQVRFLVSCKIKKHSHAVSFFTPIAGRQPSISREELFDAMLPDWYPVSEQPINLSLNVEDLDHETDYWITTERFLRRKFEERVKPVLEGDNTEHFSVFAIAPQPLLILLGSLFSDLVQMEPYQKQREPQTWQWGNTLPNNALKVHCPEGKNGPPALIISTSDTVARERVARVLGDDCSIWEVTVDTPGLDVIKHRDQVVEFRHVVRGVLSEIRQAFGFEIPLHVFPVTSTSLAVCLGYLRQPKASMPWIIYDQNLKTRRFEQSIRLG